MTKWLKTKYYIYKARKAAKRISKQQRVVLDKFNKTYRRM